MPSFVRSSRIFFRLRLAGLLTTTSSLSLSAIMPNSLDALMQASQSPQYDNMRHPEHILVTYIQAAASYLARQGNEQARKQLATGYSDVQREHLQILLDHVQEAWQNITSEESISLNVAGQLIRKVRNNHYLAPR